MHRQRNGWSCLPSRWQNVRGERRIESHKSNGMGAKDEQHPESSGRSCSSRANL